MKKLLLLATFAISFCASAQDLYIQNYTDTVIQYVVWRLNPLNTSGNCISPYLQSSSSVTGLSTLTYSTSPGAVSVDAFYSGDINTSNTFNPFYPQTPLIDTWTLDSNYSSPYTLPSNPVPAAAISGSKWGGIKLGVQDQSGNNIGGYYSMGYFCGSPTAVAGFSGVINGTFFEAGGATWMVLY
ncbi:hypothetical protein [Chryseobacterium sp. SIMBA_038]|uniref:hypothetical protein n=1 Tax=Chryseobacterium sp. SIMBA_038 TaxID=3085780 RepID=UPI00397A98E5